MALNSGAEQNPSTASTYKTLPVIRIIYFDRIIICIFPFRTSPGNSWRLISLERPGSETCI